MCASGETDTFVDLDSTVLAARLLLDFVGPDQAPKILTTLITELQETVAQYQVLLGRLQQLKREVTAK
jgi:ABC-type transporter Mla subunit MlaD